MTLEMRLLASLARPAARTTLATALALTCSAVPAFLFGALSDRLRAELGFGEVGVGAGVTVFFAAAALGAYPAGRITDRLGAATAVRVGASAATVASVGIGALAGTWWQAAALLAVAGASVGLVDTGTARAFSRAVRPTRQGLAFGLKEASVPGASMLAGVTLPLVAGTVGWRPSFAVGVVLLPLVWLGLPGSAGAADARPTAPAAVDPPHQRAATPGTAEVTAPSRRVVALALTTVACALGVGAANAAAAFLAPSATAGGLTPGAAGALLAAASLASIAMRVATGGMADRRPGREMAVTALLLGLGALGALASAGGTAAAAVVGALLVLGAGWGWSGLVFLAAIRAGPARPAASAGMILTGLAAGGALGPLGFGTLVSAGGYPVAWVATAAAMGAGAVVAGAADRRLRCLGAPA